MALIKCHECDNDVSTDAKSCPKCGAKVIAPKVKKPTSNATKIILVLGVAAVFGVAISEKQRKEDIATKEASKTPEQKAAEAKRGKQINVAVAGAMVLKKSAKDPTSFSLESLVVTKTGYGCYEFRAKNGFGAVFPSSAVMKPDGVLLSKEKNEREFVKNWNSECTKPGGDDVTRLANREIE